jgi:hypothetical protein
MSIQLNVQSINDVDTDLQKYVTESDGKFMFDNVEFKKGLLAERAVSDGLRTELNAYKGLGMSMDQIKAYVALGKTPAEIAEAIAKAANPQQNDTGDVTKTTQYLELQKKVTALEGFQQKYEEERQKVRANTRDQEVRKLINGLPDEIDKERLTALAEEVLFGKFDLNDAGDALNAVGDTLPADFLSDFAKKHGFLKSSTPGNANPGNANMNQSGRSAAFASAKQTGDIMGMLDSAPDFNANAQQ